MANEGAESELEDFRQRWRQEVSARSKPVSEKTTQPTAPANGPGRSLAKAPPPIERAAIAEEDHEGRTYHDLEDKDRYLTLENEHERAQAFSKEPKSALDHYERAVERETQGSLGDSVSLYRRAFKLDFAVQEAYKKKHFPQPPPQPPKHTRPNPSNASPTVPSTAHHSVQGGDTSISELIADYSKLSIAPSPPESDLSPPLPCQLASLPEEILVQILQAVGTNDVANMTKLSMVCKRLAYIVMTEDSIWKSILFNSPWGMKEMHYRYACDLKGRRLLEASDRPAPPMILDLTPKVYSTYRGQYRRRPRLRFNGCYISTVNYTRPGGASQSRFTWNSPVHIVTYFRYLRFFRDGSCISLLTTTEPADTVHHLTKENVHDHHSGALPSAVMKDALPGRWRLSGSEKHPYDEADLERAAKGPGEYDLEPSEYHESEEEGDVHVETDGVIPKYMWKMHFSLGNSGRKHWTRNNKLSWKGFWSYNRLTDDWGKLGLKNDRAFYWSRVKSYAP